MTGKILKIGTSAASILFASAAFLVRANAAEPGGGMAPPTTTLDAIVVDVLERNPELAFYKAEIDAAKAERRIAGTLANPELTSSIGDKRVSVGSVTSDGIAWSASVKQTFEWPGRVPLSKAIANSQINIAGLDLDQFKVA